MKLVFENEHFICYTHEAEKFGDQTFGISIIFTVEMVFKLKPNWKRPLNILTFPLLVYKANSVYQFLKKLVSDT